MIMLGKFNILSILNLGCWSKLCVLLNFLALAVEVLYKRGIIDLLFQVLTFLWDLDFVVNLGVD